MHIAGKCFQDCVDLFLLFVTSVFDRYLINESETVKNNNPKPKRILQQLAVALLCRLDTF